MVVLGIRHKLRNPHKLHQERKCNLYVNQSVRKIFNTLTFLWRKFGSLSHHISLPLTNPLSFTSLNTVCMFVRRSIYRHLPRFRILPVYLGTFFGFKKSLRRLLFFNGFSKPSALPVHSGRYWVHVLNKLWVVCSWCYALILESFSKGCPHNKIFLEVTMLCNSFVAVWETAWERLFI